MKKNVVMIRSNGVKPDSRVEKEAASLIEAGFNVIVLAWDRDADYKPTQENKRFNEKISINLIRFGNKGYFGGGKKNIRPYLKFRNQVIGWLKSNKKSIDIIHACDFDTAVFTHKFAKKHNIKFIFDIFDFKYGNPKNYIQKIIKKKQLKLISQSDATIICSEERKKQILGSNPKQLIVIHNTPYASIEKDNTFIIQKSEKNRIKISYVGILQNGRLLQEVCEAISKNDEYEFHVAGFGLLEEYFKEKAMKYNNIFFYGRIQYGQTLYLEEQCDIMLAIYDPSVENHVFAAPNKFYEALFLGKPLIMVGGTGMSNIVSEYKLGATIDYSKEGFIDGLNKLKSVDFDRTSIVAKELYNKYFSWKIMQERLIELYYVLIDGGKNDFNNNNKL